MIQSLSLKKVLHPVPTQRAPGPAILVLSILYTVGLVGILLPIHPNFILLTPVNLLISTFILLWYHAPEWDWKTWFYLGFCYAAGFLVEVMGVNTGYPFGAYTYGQVLGPKLWNTPLMIGVNWVILTYSIGVILKMRLPRWHYALRALLGSFVLVFLDILIEPVAIRYNMWTWEAVTVPLENYFSWQTVAFVLLLIFGMLMKDAQNKVAMPLFIWQIVFFATLNLIS